MGLKTDIENAFLKNIKVYKDSDYEVSAEGQEKVSELAQDLSDAIVNWVTKQEFRVDKLSAPVFIPIGTFINGGAPIPAAGPPGAPLIAPGTPITLAGTTGPFVDSTADVDVNGQTANGSLLGKSASDNSVVKLRTKEVKEA